MELIKILALDVGASGGKAIVGLIDAKEGTLKTEEVNRFPNFPVKIGRNLYWDITAIWEKIKDSIKLASTKFGGLDSVGIDTWGVDFALLDKNGDLLGIPMAYRNSVFDEAMKGALKKIPKEEIYFKTGIQFMQFNTIYQLYYLAQKQSPLLLNAKKLLMIPDLFNYWLTGIQASEYTNASTTQILSPDKKWCYDLIDRLDISSEIFPEIVDSGLILGRLDKGLAEDLKLDGRPEVIAPATHDTASAVAGGPLVGNDVGFISSGTWDLVGLELKKPIINEGALHWNFTNEGGAFNTITFLKNMQGMWILQEIKRLTGEAGKDYSYDDLTRLAEASPTEVGVIDVDDPRFLPPGDMLSEIRRYLEETKQPVPDSLGGILRVYFSSITLKRKLILERAESITGKKLGGVNVFGGGSRNHLLNQMTADAIESTVYAGPDEATALGNIAVQATGLKVISSVTEMRKMLKDSLDIKVYTPSGKGELQKSYEKLLALTQNWGTFLG